MCTVHLKELGVLSIVYERKGKGDGNQEPGRDEDNIGVAVT